MSKRDFSLLVFRDEKDVRNLTPELSRSLPNKGYVVVLKQGFRTVTSEQFAELSNRPRIQRVLFHDIYDSSTVRIELAKLCADKHVYLKANLVNGESAPKGFDLSKFNVFSCPQFPVPKMARVWRKLDLAPKDPKDHEFDIFWAGAVGTKSRSRRKDRVKALDKACGKLGLRGKFVYNSRFRPSTYLQLMNNSTLCYSGPGIGYRCRREWEIMMAGSCMVMDNIYRKRGVQIVDYTPDTYEIMEDNVTSELERLLNNRTALYEKAQRGFELARQFVTDAERSMNLRWLRAYLLDPKANLKSPADLIAKEKELGL